MNRSDFIRGRKNSAIRPPWTLAESLFTGNCSRCNQCIEACPEHIIKQGSGSFPEIDFHQGECTFCQQCASACNDNLFDSPDTAPWSLNITVSDQCLSASGITCLSCAEQCESESISFEHKTGGISIPVINNETCNGCGACIKPCPVSAISAHIPTGKTINRMETHA